MAPELPIGTVDLPDRVDRDRYFEALSYLEMSGLFAGPLKPGALAKWAEVAPKGGLGLAAPWVLTQRKPPSSAKAWAYDATSGDFRDSAPGKLALAALHDAVVAVSARAAWCFDRHRCSRRRPPTAIACARSSAEIATARGDSAASSSGSPMASGRSARR